MSGASSPDDWPAPSGRTIGSVRVTVQWGSDDLARLREAFEPAEVIVCTPDDGTGIAPALERADVAILAGDFA